MKKHLISGKLFISYLLAVSFMLTACNSKPTSSVSSLGSMSSEISAEIVSSKTPVASSSINTESSSKKNGQQSSGGQYKELGVFMQKSPDNAMIATSTKPTFEWTSAENATGYRISIAKDSSFKTIIYEKEIGNTTKYTIDKDLSNNTTYYWRVKAMNETGTANPMNSAMSFMTVFDVGGYIDVYLQKNPIAIEQKPMEAGNFYTPRNASSWDYWFIKKDNTYHAFHLERPLTEPADYIAVGHATSTDLQNWSYYGTVIKAQSGKWDDLRIATGSTVYKDGIYYMVYTGHSSTNTGIGVSVSKDLFRWVKMGDAPIISSDKAFRAAWKGEEVEVTVGADPYIYPEAVNGYYYMVANSFIKNGGENNGCLLMLKSKDLLNWESAGIVAHTGTFLRMETPQIWQKNGRWYLYFGGVTAAKNNSTVDSTKTFKNGDSEYVSNYIYVGNTIDGEYTAQSWSNFKLPDNTPFYICKTLINSTGQDVMLCHLWGVWKLSKPYILSYDSSGKVLISQ